MAGQHSGERSIPDEPVSVGDRVVEWVCVGIAILMFAGQFAYLITLLTGTIRTVFQSSIIGR